MPRQRHRRPPTSDRLHSSMHTSALDTRRGYFYAIAAALLWAISGSSAKYLFQAGVTPTQLVQLRTVIATTTLLLWLVMRYPHLLRISPTDIGYFALYGLVGIAGLQFTYLLAISKIQVAAAILLQYLAPAFIVLHTVLFVRERISLSTGAALALATLGCYLVVGAYNLELLSLNRVGIISGILSGLAFAWCSIHGEHGMRRYNPWTVLLYALFFGAVVWNVAHPPLESFFHSYRAVEWGWILYIGILGTLAPFGLYLEGVNLIRSTRASITAILEPIAAGLLAFWFLGEAMAPPQIAGGILVLGSIILLQRTHQRDDKAPALLRGRNRPS